MRQAEAIRPQVNDYRQKVSPSEFNGGSPEQKNLPLIFKPLTIGVTCYYRKGY